MLDRMCSWQVFLNVATGGFGTELTVKTDEDLKNKLGGAAYLFTGVTWLSQSNTHGQAAQYACASHAQDDFIKSRKK